MRRDTVAQAQAGAKERKPTDAEIASVTTALLKMGYPQPDLDKVRASLASLKIRRYGPGEVIIEEGDKPGDAFVTHTGIVEVFKATAEGREVKIAEVAPGSVVGEMALLTGYPRSATVKAKGECELFVVAPPVFRMLVDASPVFKAKMDALIEERRRALARV